MAVKSKVFGVHWTTNDNGEMLALLSDAERAGKPLSAVLILGNVNNVSVREVMRRSPDTKIIYRGWYPWNGSAVENYSPPNGWGRATYEQGRDLARWYIANILTGNSDANITKGNNVWHCAYNEPGIGSDTGDTFIAWHNGFADVMEAFNYQFTSWNLPPGFPALANLPGDLGKEGYKFWITPTTWDYIRRMEAGHNFINMHAGDIYHASNFRGPFDSLRHREIRKMLPPDIRNVTFLASEYYLFDLENMGAGLFAANLSEGQALLANDGIIPVLWQDGWTPGFKQDDFRNKFATYRQFILG